MTKRYEVKLRQTSGGWIWELHDGTISTWIENAGMPFTTREEAAAEGAKALVAREEKARRIVWLISASGASCRSQPRNAISLDSMNEENSSAQHSEDRCCFKHNDLTFFPSPSP